MKPFCMFCLIFFILSFPSVYLTENNLTEPEQMDNNAAAIMDNEPIIKQKHILPREPFPNEVWHKERINRDILAMTTFGTATVVGILYTTKPTWSRFFLKLLANRRGPTGSLPKSAAFLLPFAHPMLSQSANHSTFPHNLVSPTVHRRFVIAGRAIAFSTVLFLMYLLQLDKRFVKFCEDFKKDDEDSDH